MMKSIKFLVLVLLLSGVASTAMAAPPKKGAKSSATATKAMTAEEFAKKWGEFYAPFSQNCYTEIGWPKQFFLDMMAAIPNHFKMKRDCTDQGIDYYVGVLVRGDDAVMYKIGFNGKKLWIFDYQFADWDASKANFLRELNWKRTDEGFDKEEDALWGSEDSDF